MTASAPRFFSSFALLSPRATATTLAPSTLEIWTAATPTPPAAPSTSTVWPAQAILSHKEESQLRHKEESQLHTGPTLPQCKVLHLTTCVTRVKHTPYLHSCLLRGSHLRQSEQASKQVCKQSQHASKRHYAMEGSTAGPQHTAV